MESQYLYKLRSEVLENQCLIMTLQSFNKLNVIAIKHNLLCCISSREFTDSLKEYCQLQIQQRSLDEIGFAVLINELGKIEKDFHGNSFFTHLVRQHSDKITERIEKFTLKQLLLIVSGFGAYFIDKSSVQKSPPELREIMLKISE